LAKYTRIPNFTLMAVHPPSISNAVTTTYAAQFAFEKTRDFWVFIANPLHQVLVSVRTSKD
jgi:hypothetical protein